MMIEPLYDFSLTAEQEARARTLHESSIILDMLFQGPVGTYSLPEGAEEELLALAQEACPATRSPSVTGQRLRSCAG